MTILEFEEEYNKETGKYLGLDSGLHYIRTIIYNTHEYIKSDKLKDARLNLLFTFDELYGTNINDRTY